MFNRIQHITYFHVLKSITCIISNFYVSQIIRESERKSHVTLLGVVILTDSWKEKYEKRHRGERAFALRDQKLANLEHQSAWARREQRLVQSMSHEEPSL